MRNGNFGTYVGNICLKFGMRIHQLFMSPSCESFINLLIYIVGPALCIIVESHL